MKQVLPYSDEVKKEIIEAVDIISDPIRGTLSPKGSNVIYEDSKGDHYVTNDGITIAKNITLSDPIKNATVEIIKHSALKTNTIAGDGTSTTILLSSILVKEGMKLIGNGMNPMDLKKELTQFGLSTCNKLKKMSRVVKTDEDKFFLANISANNDVEIAKDVVKIVNTAGEDGLVFFDTKNEPKTEIIEDTGFIIKGGMLSPELTNIPNAFVANYENVPVLVTDKRLYYQQEAETILKTCLDAGYNEVVIIARDFVGEALPYFIANHAQGNMRVLLIKDPAADKNNGVTLEDLAVYLGGNTVTEKTGSIVDKLKIENFLIASRVYSDQFKTIVSRPKSKNSELNLRIQALKKEIKKKPTTELKDRLASLTNGMVTVNVGGATRLEIRERMFRYEDAVNATRAAIKDGYLVGGGVSLYRAARRYKGKPEMKKLYRLFAEASLRQIAENCGVHPDNMMETINIFDNESFGYNALTGTYEDLLKAGVVDPYKVTEMAVENSISIANVILSSNYLILKENDKSNKED